MKLKQNKNVILTYLAAFFLPFFVMLITYAILGIFPFGDRSLLTIDLYHQYIDFLGYLRDFLTGNGSALYSFSKALGGNMIGLFAYYLCSPLNIILVLFPKAMFSEAIMALSLLKVGFCGLTFTVFLRHVFPGNKRITTLLFSTCYALMAYNLVFQQNIMWLDGVIWLPIVILGLHRLVTRGKFLLYGVSLGVALFSNYYIGYMLCIFSVLYFAYQMFLSGFRDDLFARKKQILIRIAQFLGGSLIAAGLCSIILVPTFLALQTGKASFDVNRFALSANFEFVHLLQKFFIGEMDIHLLHRGIQTTLPDIFCGTLMLLLSILYFCNKKIQWKEKAASGTFLAIMVLSFHIKTFDLLWHGFNTPIGFLYRNTFLFCFLMIVFAYKCFVNLDGISIGNIFAAVFGYICLGVFVANFALDTLAPSDIWLSVAVFSIYGLLLILYQKPDVKKPALIIASVVFLSAELILSGALMLEELSYTSRRQFVQDIRPLEQTVQSVKQKDDGFYRMEKNFDRSRNDAAMQNYNAISHSSSTADRHVVNILNKFGFRDDSNIGNIYDEGSTLPVNAMLSMKYVLSKTSDDYPYYTNTGGNTPYYVYQNPYALSLGFASAPGVDDLSPKTDDPFALQNQLFSTFTNGKVKQVLRPLRSERTLHNILNIQSGKLTNYTKIKEGELGYIEFALSAPNDEEIYAFFPTEPISDSTCAIYVNGVNTKTYFDSDHLSYYDIMNLGKFKKDEKITVRIELLKDRVDFSEALFYALDLGAFQSAYADIAKNQMTITQHGESSIRGEVDIPAGKPVLFTTIPTDRGWRIKVDGNPITPEMQVNALGDTFIALHLPPGHHSVEFAYTPPGLGLGILLTSLTCLGLGLYCLVQFLHRRKLNRQKLSPATPKVGDIASSIVNDL